MGFVAAPIIVWAMGWRWISVLLVVQSLACPLSAQDDGLPFRAKVRGLVGADLAVLEDGRRVRLQGLTLPTPAVRPREFVRGLRSWLEPQLIGRELRFEPDVPNPVGESADLTAVVRAAPDAPSLNAQALAKGLALFGCQTATVASGTELSAASLRAQRERRGWFATTPRPRVDSVSYLNGAVLGLHHRDPQRTYERELDELAGAGFVHVSLIFSGFLADVTAWRIDRHHVRTVRDSRLIETIRYARSKGMTVALLPIVLLEEAGDDDWRGTIRPEPEAKFWVEYDRFLSHYLDIAEATGVELFSVGSEYGSLEDRTATWMRLIQNARGRFTGLLTYSANWDHVHVPKFLGALDAVGMTAYFSLSDDPDASTSQLVEGWRSVAAELRETVASIERPVFFTELGYASQNGINTDPWNYFIAVDDIDLVEQRQSFEAALRVLPGLEWLYGAYWFDYYGEGGRGDISYCPRGKPAFEVWKRWAAIESKRVIRRAKN